MDKKELEALKDEIMDLFSGLRHGRIDYHYDNLNCAMKTDICEVFSDIAEDFVMDVMSGSEVTKEQLQKLHDDLVSFGEEFEVKEVDSVAEKVKALIE